MPPYYRPSRMLAAAATATVLAAGVLLPATADAADPLLPIPGGTTPSQGAEPQQAARRPTAFNFKLATFNILGSQHTAGPGGYGPGTHRARITARMIKHKNVDVIGMQEVQTDQYRVLHNRLDHYRIWPGTRLGNQGIRLQIAWREHQFKLLRTGTITTRFDHQSRPVPWVKLKNRSTGRKMYVVDIHNSPQGEEAERDSATRAEIRLINRLRQDHKPVFVVGDMNEKTEWFCKVAGHTDVRSANGGHAGPDRCSPPQRRLRIDWLMGGRRIDFSHYREDDGGQVRQASDHEFLHTRVHVRSPR
ncbi:endonuclease/exonuclease/phosphatase family metal-dependent hydrolase [Nocardioides ginsengisegetis]|uniref:Endonuclease/exonuclease/phosphatase family metal-dependent hydrolase n=1 Tax=Nocardioides ginsengisegetis TaxID=661491 RepID=A0A7W3J1G9_9ACTN|nr:endonuclease/exonuclease/phosphatase family protein [Nocardioides ginsengisegetis]MBA8804563.1 endonuclease/exonuclease/phosphatase family metal-dependent hydrolase [Nocardioides ginsengisegetis]